MLRIGDGLTVLYHLFVDANTGCLDPRPKVKVIAPQQACEASRVELVLVAFCTN